MPMWFISNLENMSLLCEKYQWKVGWARPWGCEAPLWLCGISIMPNGLLSVDLLCSYIWKILTRLSHQFVCVCVWNKQMTKVSKIYIWIHGTFLYLRGYCTFCSSMVGWRYRELKMGGRVLHVACSIARIIWSSDQVAIEYSDLDVRSPHGIKFDLRLWLMLTYFHCYSQGLI